MVSWFLHDCLGQNEIGSVCRLKLDWSKIRGKGRTHTHTLVNTRISLAANSLWLLWTWWWMIFLSKVNGYVFAWTFFTHSVFPGQRCVLWHWWMVSPVRYMSSGWLYLHWSGTGQPLVDQDYRNWAANLGVNLGAGTQSYHCDNGWASDTSNW
jgi:hypothetical protein